MDKTHEDVDHLFGSSMHTQYHWGSVATNYLTGEYLLSIDEPDMPVSGSEINWWTPLSDVYINRASFPLSDLGPYAQVIDLDESNMRYYPAGAV